MIHHFFIEILISETSLLSIESMARALNLSLPIVLLKKLLIRFNVEKHLSFLEVVIGVVIKIFSNFEVSQKVVTKFRELINCKNSVKPLKQLKSGLAYNKANSARSLDLFSIR